MNKYMQNLWFRMVQLFFEVSLETLGLAYAITFDRLTNTMTIYKRLRGE